MNAPTNTVDTKDMLMEIADRIQHHIGTVDALDDYSNNHQLSYLMTTLKESLQVTEAMVEAMLGGGYQDHKLENNPV